MQQCFNVLTDIYNLFLLQFHCCILLKIKLTTTATAAAAIAIATAATAATATATATTAAAVAMTTTTTIEDASTCTLTQYPVVFHLNLLLHSVCKLGNRLFVTWLVWSGLQFCADLFSSDRCWGKCNLAISMTFYTCKTAVATCARQYLVLWRRTSTELPAAHEQLSPPVALGTWNNWKVLTENASRW